MMLVKWKTIDKRKLLLTPAPFSTLNDQTLNLPSSFVRHLLSSVRDCYEPNEPAAVLAGNCRDFLSELTAAFPVLSA